MLDKIKKGLRNLWDYFWNKHFLFSIYLLLSFFFFLLVPPSLSVILTWALVTITIAYAISTEESAEIARKTMVHQALLDLQKEYRSGEMLSALETLWNLHGDCKEKGIDLKNEYELKDITDKSQISTGIIRLEDSLSYKRRLVTHFYFHLAGLYKEKILPGDVIFSNWSYICMDIIREIVIPLDEKQEEMSGVDEIREEKKLPKAEIEKLKKLRKDAYYHYRDKYNRDLKFEE